MVKSFIKKQLIRGLHNLRITEFAIQLFCYKKALILAYHRFAYDSFIKEHRVMPGMYVSALTFEDHLKWIISRFDVVTLDSLVDDINIGKSWARPRVVITIDDGWMDNYIHAFPLLKKYDIPATIFITEKILAGEINCFDLCFELICSGVKMPENLTGISQLDYFFVGDHGIKSTEKARRAVNIIRQLSFNEFNEVYAKLIVVGKNLLNYDAISKRYRLLGVPEVLEMVGSGVVDFGYHSKSHYMLTCVPPEKLIDEVVPSALIEKFSGLPLKKIFCYPDGQFNKTIISTLRKNKFKGAVSLVNGFNTLYTDPFVLRRVNLHQGNSGTISDFAATIGLLNR